MTTSVTRSFWQNNTRTAWPRPNHSLQDQDQDIFFLVSDRSCPKTDGLRPHHCRYYCPFDSKFRWTCPPCARDRRRCWPAELTCSQWPWHVNVHYTHNVSRVQSDIVHQSVMELIHSEDREQFKTQLNWRSALPQDVADLTLDQAMQPGLRWYITYFRKTVKKYAAEFDWSVTGIILPALLFSILLKFIVTIFWRSW